MNCCTYDCNEGRDCPVRQSTVDGGHQVNGSLSFPLHRQVMPPDENESYTAGLWWAWTAVTLILLTFFGMCWLVYPNLPQ